MATSSLTLWRFYLSRDSLIQHATFFPWTHRPSSGPPVDSPLKNDDHPSLSLGFCYAHTLRPQHRIRLVASLHIPSYQVFPLSPATTDVLTYFSSIAAFLRHSPLSFQSANAEKSFLPSLGPFAHAHWFAEAVTGNLGPLVLWQSCLIAQSSISSDRVFLRPCCRCRRGLSDP